jgi:ArsR family transcriptional regulator
MAKQKAPAILRALGHPQRIQILDMLATGEKCVCEMLPVLNAPQPNISQHLIVLRAAGIVESERRGSNVYYWLTAPEISQVVNAVRRIAGDPIPEPYQPLSNPCTEVNAQVEISPTSREE